MNRPQFISLVSHCWALKWVLPPARTLFSSLLVLLSSTPMYGKLLLRVSYTCDKDFILHNSVPYTHKHLKQELHKTFTLTK